MTWINTHSGQDFDFLRPDASKVRDTDIAAALAKLNRWTGHTRSFYSVAQHSILVANLLPPDLAFYGLLHDAHEAYTGDLSTPLQWALVERLPDFREVFDTMRMQVDAEIYEYFMVAPPSPEARRAIKQADLQALAAEKRDLMPEGRAWDWEVPDASHIPPIGCWAPERAEANFLHALEVMNPYGAFSRWEERSLFHRLRTLSRIGDRKNAGSDLYQMARECSPAT